MLDQTRPLKATLLVTNIGELATPNGQDARFGEASQQLSIIPNAVIAVDIERIVWAGPAEQLPPLEGPALEVVDARGQAVIPGFVDSHTHFVFGGWRADEFLWRAMGVPYMEIHERGGGIANSVRATRAAGRDGLLPVGLKRLNRMLELGVTTVEGKSGYGLDLETELLQLEVMKQLDGLQPVDIVATFMGAHSIPVEYQGRPAAYIDWLIAVVLPAVKKQGIAEFCDIFCEKGVFELADSRRYLLAARELGFELKLHADEIVRLGGAGLAAELKAASADHLLKADPLDLAAMAEAGTVATCLPLTAFVLREPYADARAMLDAGCAVALASDFNPGSCYSQSIPLAIALAVLYMHMSSEEVLTALTLNGAAALKLAHDRGSLEVGKLADILILDAPSYKHLAYHSGMNLVETVIKRGKVVSRLD
ncbi:MAG: imidazolonepropionase [Spirochaetes bacterium GWD1_61_31]|nr:MAG: imidazolonepropionase [Spirochaetes bacterium GWB1_60_80]OHD28666.1 MAG: imidazolonepropionase [Spirochaetes bacterium GWC1_61_12]OHD34951.1 MAG: imidazolonepropionase [Spirochaetes bacterium GWD1_61_31]OHD43308.1 MAG: imidazolonepropionase [Spirochaetes bacterium GWE1_60_18]OHD58846.1 MAG: imidazolonepropionase [Spirochaetes bacterium GWF1_60_12]HAP42500.1 imidazolonepropionase [Spirochaetaceae bacterium]